MARAFWTFLTAVALAMQAGSIPIDDTNMVITSDSQNPGSPASKSPAKPENPPKILSMHVTSDVEFRFARTLINSVVENTAKNSQEVSFSVVLPQDAFITGFEMEIDGKKYRAYIQKKEEAKKTYDEAVQQGQGAAHVAYSARESNSFDVSVNIEPQKKVSFVLTYEELLTRSKGLYHNTVTISPGQIIPDMSVKMHIKEPRTITKLYVPAFSSDDKVTTVEDDPCADTNTTWTICAIANPIAKKTDVSLTETIVEFTPTIEDQEKLAKEKGKGMTGQFKVMYDVERDPSGGEVLVKDGYFVHFFAPTDLKILPKHIVFVLDISGSMDGRRLEQLKEAMKTILPSLQPDDYFNIIVFSTSVISWDLDNKEADLETEKEENYYHQYHVNDSPDAKPEPKPEPEKPDREAVPAYPATKEYIDKALKRIEETNTDSSTNIFGALRQAIKTVHLHRERLEKDKDLKARKSIIMFLTDGEANVGESRPEYIISGLSELNVAPQAPIYSLTFGEYGDIDFLKKLSVANSGLARIIYEGADADIQLKRFYHDISSPLLSDVKFKYLPSEVDLESTTKIDYHTYYQGGELVVAGRTATEDVNEITADVIADSKDANKDYAVKSLIYLPAIQPWWPVICPMPMPEPSPVPREQKPTSSLERAWAYLTVKQLIDEWEAEKSKEREEDKIKVETVDYWISAPQTKRIVTTEVSPSDNSKAKKRALELALKYSFVTKLTSLVVVKPESSQATDAKRIVAGEDGMDPGFSLRGGVGGAMPNAMFAAMTKMAMPAMATADYMDEYVEACIADPTNPPAQTDDNDQNVDASADSDQDGDPFDKMTISDVSWVSQYDLADARIGLNVSGRQKLYDILLPWLNSRSCKAKTASSCTAPGIAAGKCRHISQCVMRVITKSVEAFLPYQCHLGNYLAVCCNE